MSTKPELAPIDDDLPAHETVVEVDPADPDAEAYLWVCACGEGDDDLSRVDAYLDAQRHERLDAQHHDRLVG